MDYMEEFIKNFKMLSNGKSVRQIAIETGIPQQTLSRYMNKNNEIKINNICILANYFKVSTDELIGFNEK